MARNKVSEEFSQFYEEWMNGLENYVQIKLGLPNEYVSEEEIIDLAAKMTQHYKDYFNMKWNLASEDVLPFFAPIWITPLERMYYWITGWKPTMMLKLIESTRKANIPDSSLTMLTEEQLKQIEALRLKAMTDEGKVDKEMERNHVALADWRMIQVAKLVSRNREMKLDPSIVEIEEILLEGITLKLENVMRNADIARLTTLKGILDVLSPMQSVDFLAGISMLLLRIRQWGKESCSIGGRQGPYNLAA